MIAKKPFPIFRVYYTAMIVFFILRIAFLTYHHHLFGSSSSSDIAIAFACGLMIDSSVTAVTIFLVRLLCFFIQPLSRVIALRVYAVLIYFLFGLFFFMNLADIIHFEQFDSRLNILLLDNLGQMGPIVRTIFQSAAVYVVTIIWIVIVSAFIWVNRRRVTTGRVSSLSSRHARISVAVSMVALFGLSFLWLGEPFWRIGTVSSTNQALNQLSLNGVYTLAKAADMARIMRRDSHGVTYRFRPDEEALNAMRELVRGTDEEFVSDLYPLARKIKHPEGLALTKPNIVIILMENYSASYVGVLNSLGKSCTPVFDRLSSDGILFTNFYGNETRTHHGLVSTVGSFPSLLGMFLTRRRGTESFYTLGTLLKDYGYSTSFIYGYEQGFDHMGFFLKQGGFTEIIDRPDYSTFSFEGQWGVSDEDMFDKALGVLSECPSTTPFLSVLMTSSNHAPFEIPPQFVQTHPEYADSKGRAAFAYSDYSLGRFIDQARQEKFFDNTIFVIVADHGDLLDPDDRNVKRFHIPCLIYAPHLIASPRVVATVGSQVDIATTLMHLIGYPEVFHFAGRDLLSTREDDGFAAMRTGFTFYWRSGSTVLMRDIRDTVSSLFAVDERSRMLPGSTIEENERKNLLNRRLEDYVQSCYYIFSMGKHRYGR